MTDCTLLTVGDRVALLVNALHPERDHSPVVKLFMPNGGAIWLLSECDPDEPDRLFGLCDLGLGSPELGYVDLKEIMQVSIKLGLPVERDNSFVPDKPLSAYFEIAKAAGRIAGDAVVVAPLEGDQGPTDPELPINESHRRSGWLS